MNNDQVKKLNGTINKQSAVSIGLVIVIISAVVWITASTTRVQADVDNIKEVTSELSENFVPRRELDQRLKNIEASVYRIEEFIIK